MRTVGAGQVEPEVLNQQASERSAIGERARF
jgi:hypothetical protein